MENQELQTTRNQSIVTIGDWIITMILMCIPFVNFIMLLVWLSVPVLLSVKPIGQKLLLSLC